MTTTVVFPNRLPVPALNNDVYAVLLKLLAYCEANDWAGYEPYDVLNSPLFTSIPLLNSKVPRLLATQAFKRSPLNLRGLFRIPKTANPKALGLFLSAFVKLAKTGIGLSKDYRSLMIEQLETLRSKNVSYRCWGYNFPWQTRTVLVPRWAPNLVCTAFAATGLLDAYEQRRRERWLEMALSAADFILNELYWTAGDTVAGFGYPLPSVHNQVYNANLLGAALFCRIHKLTGEERFLVPALRAARYCAAKQQFDGSWFYGEASTQRWIDNFHTGFNLSALRIIGQYGQTSEFDTCLRKGLNFYRKHFFLPDGAVRYFHNQTFPLDMHCVAQSIITLVDLKDLNPENLPLAHSVFQWAMKHMWNEQGFFYYRVLRSCKIRTSYMRWTQAWMFLAMASLAAESHAPGGVPVTRAGTSIEASSC